ncbi:methyltransferase domain-containing protein [Kribbella sandramycini]|uniref:Methyltransferase domain-containing protein n=1 Tax=Kribbella sandramycini TaxID=60450 RepID=A0A7Y4P0V7_9ACTN|nr:SAM-dependent methyltransferase [Kribbella sandramycini]NOL41525.1 methyltransferase domain-containing protein [Kribbella sandramycini]
MTTTGDPRRVNYARRTAETQAAFFTRHLRPGISLLDLGCGPGSITIGLAERVHPGPTTGFDLNPALPDGADHSAVELVAGDVTKGLPFEDDSFDAVFCSALLQHVPEPLAVLREVRRVTRPGAVVGLVDADWDGQLLHPANPLLEASFEVLRRLRAGTSPYVGKQLRALLTEAGFVNCESYARVVHHGTADEVAGVGAFTAGLMSGQRELIVDQQIATGAEVDEMEQAWLTWSTDPGSFLARFWIEAVAWAPEY